MQNIESIEINNEKTYRAQTLASYMSQPHIRKRAMIDILGVECAINYLDSKNVKIDTQKSVYKIPLLFEEFKITDIYYGNYRIDVITLYREKMIKIPKIHVDMEILPNFYFVVQINSTLKEARMIGFIDAKEVPSSSHDSKYYYPKLSTLFDIDKFAKYTKLSLSPSMVMGKHTDCMGLFLKFIDNDLSSVYKKQLIQHLMNCSSCRKRFIDVMEFERISRNLSYYPDTIEKCIKEMSLSDASPLSLTGIEDAPEIVQNSESNVNAALQNKPQNNTQNNTQKAVQKPVKDVRNSYKNTAQNTVSTLNNNSSKTDNKNTDIKNVIKDTVNDTQLSQKPQETTGHVLKKTKISDNTIIPRKENIIKENFEDKQQNFENTQDTQNFENTETAQINSINKKIINKIFNEIPKIELSSFKTMVSTKNRRTILIVALVLFLFVGFSLIALTSLEGDLPSIEDGNDGNRDEYSSEYDESEFLQNNFAPTHGKARLIPKERSIDDFAVERPKVTENYAPSISKISWEAPESLVKKENYSRYLQLIGKNIKLNLQNDLLLINDIPMNRKVKVDIKVASNGDINSINIARSSGSERIDAAIEKTLSETLMFMKPPRHTSILHPASVSLTIDFH